MIKTLLTVSTSIILSFLLLSPCIGEGKDNIDGILVIDTSGTMQTNDPTGFRIQGLQIFLDILSPEKNSQVGIVYFANTTRLVQPLTSLSGENLASLKQHLKEPGNEGDWTEIGRGLHKAYEELMRAGKAISTKYIILMTDGIIDRVPHNREDWMALDNYDRAAERELMNTISKLKEQKIMVFTMALTEYSRRGLKGEGLSEELKYTNGERLLLEIAKQTGGDFKRILCREDILEFMLLIRTRVSPPANIIITDNRGRFSVSKYDNAMIIITPPGATLISPSGKEKYDLNSIYLHLPSDFNIFPYELGQVIIIYRPKDKKLWQSDSWQGDDWKILTKKDTPISGVQVAIRSDVKLIWNTPIKEKYIQNEVVNIEVRLEGDRKEIDEILAKAECYCYVWSPGTKHPNEVKLKKTLSGIYHGKFDKTELPGKYKIKVEIINDKLHFRRMLWEDFEVIKKKYINFKALRRHDEKEEVLFDSLFPKKELPICRVGDTIQLIIQETPNLPELARPMDIKAKIILPSGKEKVLTFKRDEKSKTYNTEPFKLRKGGDYKIDVEVKIKESKEFKPAKPGERITRYEHPTTVGFSFGPLGVQVPLPYIVLQYLPWIIGIIFIIVLMLSVYLHLLPQLTGILQIIEPELGETYNISGNPNQKGIKRLWNMIFPKRKNTIGYSPKADHRLPDIPIEGAGGLSAMIRIDHKGNVFLHSLSSPSHTQIGNTIVEKEGIEIRGRYTVNLEGITIQIGKYKLKFS
jgi:hypothetical protein